VRRIGSAGSGGGSAAEKQPSSSISGIMRGMPPNSRFEGTDGKTVSVVVPGTEETLKKLHTPVLYLIGGEKKTSRIKNSRN